jgi:hypothetical protein
MGPLCFMKDSWQMANNRINSDWQFRCAPLPSGYAERYAPYQKARRIDHAERQ